MNVVKILLSTSRRPTSPLAATLRRRARAGFTIVEVMAAAVVMALALTTSITALQRGFVALDSARNLTMAGQILQCEMEKMRMLRWETIEAYPATLDPMPLDAGFASNPTIAPRFRLRRDVAPVATSSGVGMKEVTFTVTWTGYDGRSVSRNYTTYYGQNGLYDYYYNSL